MPKISPFQKYVDQYEAWFTENPWVYEAELRAVKSVFPAKGLSVEIGVGTGRFAEPLNIKIGVEPSHRMGSIAQKRGIQVLKGTAEELPLADCRFDTAIMVTIVCFLDDISKAFQEAHRILSKEGVLIVALIDRNSPLGQVYLEHKNENVFYRYATFFSVDEVIEIMTQSGFKDFSFQQTIFRSLSETDEKEPVEQGYGKGAFVVIKAKKA